MASMPVGSAALVIRVWREPGVAGFRGRITYSTGAAQTGEGVVAVDSAERVHATVQEWLERFLSGHPPYSSLENR